MNLQVRDFGIDFADKTVFEGLQLDVADHELVAIKTALQDGGTSLLKGIGGLLRGVAGSVKLGDHDVLQKPSAELLHRIGYVYEARGLVSLMNVRDNIALPLLYHAATFHPQLADGEADQRLEDICEKLALDCAIFERRPHQINDVHARLANLARALMVQPWMLLIDELEGGMSEAFIKQTVLQLREFQLERPMPILITAMSDAVLEQADRVYRISERKLVLECP